MSNKEYIIAAIAISAIFIVLMVSQIISTSMTLRQQRADYISVLAALKSSNISKTIDLGCYPLQSYNNTYAIIVICGQPAYMYNITSNVLIEKN